MALHRKRRGADLPHIPFYKDEKVVGKTITVSVSIRLFVLAVVVFVVAFGWGLFKVIDDDSQLHNYLRHAHDSRLADQAKTQAEIDQLACYIIANIPDSEAPIVPKVRAQYGCPPYGKDPNFKLYKPSKKSSAKPKQHAKAGGAPSKKATSHSGSGGGVSASGPGAPTPTTGSGGSSSHSGGGSSGGGSGGGGSSSPPPSSSSAPVVKLPVQLPPVITAGPVGVGGTCTLRVGGVCVVGS